MDKVQSPCFRKNKGILLEPFHSQIFFCTFAQKYNNMCVDSAEYIKTVVIDWLLSHHPSVTIGNEVMYGSKRKVVDLLAIIDHKAIAIEIKSASDNLIRLPDQIAEYRKAFDMVIIITTPSHLSGIKQLISKGIGLYVINKSIKRISAPRINHKLDKLEMLYSVSSGFLKKKYPQYKYMNSDEIRIQLSKRNMTVVHQLFISFFQQKLSERFNFFMKERGKFTLVDDIPTLSSLTHIELF